MKFKKTVLFLVLLVVVSFFGFRQVKKINFNQRLVVGQPVDSLNGVYVYYNGGVDHVADRNVQNGYNLGLKYQCVEFVKRYYYQHLNRKMPDSYGHAKDFFNDKLKDGELNTARNLIQYSNPGTSRPQLDDLLIFNASLTKCYGHVAIVSRVADQEIELIQQNPGPFGTSRESVTLTSINGKWKIENNRIVGWLRKE